PTLAHVAEELAYAGCSAVTHSLANSTHEMHLEPSTTQSTEGLWASSLHGGNATEHDLPLRLRHRDVKYPADGLPCLCRALQLRERRCHVLVLVRPAQSGASLVDTCVTLVTQKSWPDGQNTNSCSSDRVVASTGDERGTHCGWRSSSGPR